MVIGLYGAFVGSAAYGAVWTSGHGDIGIGFDGKSFEPHFHFHEEEEHDDDHGDDDHGDDDHGDDDDHDHDHEEGEHAVIDGAEPTKEEYGIGELTIRFGGPRQPGAGIADSGASTVYVLAQDEGLADALESPWMGWSIEELDAGVFQNDTVTLSLLGVDGPGVFSLWNTGPFGGDVTIMSSAVGSDAPGSLAMTLDPGHFHYNLGFSEKGDYEVTLRAEGTLAGTDQTLSEDFTVRFQAVPEPSSLFLVLLGGLAALRRKRA